MKRKTKEIEPNKKLCTITFYLLMISLVIFPIAYILKNYYTFPNNTIAMSISMTLLALWAVMNTICFSNKHETIILILLILTLYPVLFFLIPDHVIKKNIYNKIIFMLMASSLIALFLLWIYSKICKIMCKLKAINNIT